MAPSKGVREEQAFGPCAMMLSSAVYYGEPNSGLEGKKEKSLPRKSHVLSKFMVLCRAAIRVVLRWCAWVDTCE